MKRTISAEPLHGGEEAREGRVSGGCVRGREGPDVSIKRNEAVYAYCMGNRLVDKLMMAPPQALADTTN